MLFLFSSPGVHRVMLARAVPSFTFGRVGLGSRLGIGTSSLRDESAAGGLLFLIITHPSCQGAPSFAFLSSS
eukprot:765683-Hanusia_phi.AAC.1